MVERVKDEGGFVYTIDFPMQHVVTRRPRGIRGFFVRIYWTVSNWWFDMRCKYFDLRDV